MNQFDDRVVEEQSFAFRNLIGQDRWTAWSPIPTSLTVVGAPSYVGRTRIVGKECQFQAKLSAATSIASVAGTTYLALPFTAMGLSGEASMTDETTKIAVGLCHIDVINSRCYLPTQLASGDVFHVAGRFEV